jgi:hypothetical protein
VKKDRRSNDLLRPFVRGRDIRRYHVKSSGGFFPLVPPERTGDVDEKTSWRWMQEQYPAVARRLNAQDTATLTIDDRKAPWYVTVCRDVFAARSRKKILFPATAVEPVFTFDDGRSLIDRDTGYLVSGSLYLLAVLNSRLARYWFMHRKKLPEDTRLTDIVAAVAGFFIHVPDLDDPRDAGRQNRIETLARKMLVYHEQLAGGRDESVREHLRKKIGRTDHQINALVYELYGLTPEEIAVVEESAGR